jgi:DNA uptake protein ComE-like DNA-binding protein
MLANSNDDFNSLKIASTNKQLYDPHCQILQQCIDDVKSNSQKYHIYFMLQTINSGDIDQILHLKTINRPLAKKLIQARQYGVFESLAALDRAGLSKDMIHSLARYNS